MSEMADMEEEAARIARLGREAKAVRCNQCQAADLNEFSPVVGFCCCRKFPKSGGGWANAERFCSEFIQRKG